jgi:hypothetical protein
MWRRGEERKRGSCVYKRERRMSWKTFDRVGRSEEEEEEELRRRSRRKGRRRG